jgi:antirestriction protein ArdC
MSIQEKREKLKDLSSRAKAIKEELLKRCTNPSEVLAIEEMTVNQIIVNYIYKDDQHLNFDTFKGWIKNGFAVRKGEKAFLLWGRKKQTEVKPNGEERTEELEFFPVTYVFSNAQVEPLNS